MIEETQLCIAVTFPQTLETPPEYCENEAVEGEEYCPQHLADDEDWEPDFLFDYDDLEPFE